MALALTVQQVASVVILAERPRNISCAQMLGFRALNPSPEVGGKLGGESSSHRVSTAAAAEGEAR